MTMEDFLIRRELIIFNSGETTVEGIFKEASELLLEKGYVCETYMDALLERESEHPTALELENIRIAIPHADPKHVKKGGIMAVKLDKAATFHSMLDGRDVEVSHVFFLILTNGTSHLEALSGLMTMMQRREKVEQIKACESADELYQVLQDGMPQAS